MPAKLFDNELLIGQYCARYGVYLFCPYPKDRSATQFITQLLSQAKGTSGIN